MDNIREMGHCNGLRRFRERTVGLPHSGFGYNRSPPQKKKHPHTRVPGNKCCLNCLQLAGEDIEHTAQRLGGTPQ